MTFDLRIISLCLLAVALVACGDKDTGDDSGDVQDTEDTQDTDDTQQDSEAPVITDAYAVCGLHDIGDKYYYWSMWCQGDDPQGQDTLERYEGDLQRVWVLDPGNNVLADYALSCDPDNGQCSGATSQDADNIVCASAANYTFRFRIADEDGNQSAPYDVVGAQE